MPTFVFNPNAKRETLEEFNARLKHYCHNNHCMSAEVGALGKSLIINCQEPDGLDLGIGETIEVPLIMPIVYTISDADVTLEENITKYFDESEFKSNKDPIIPIGQKIVLGSLIEDVQHGYLIVFCSVGSVDISSNMDDDDD